MALVDQVWDEEIVPALTEFIRIPNLSVMFDPRWAEHGHMAEAAELVRAWCERRPVAGLTVELVELPGLTPVVVVDVPASGGGPADETVILYGHIDKQPEMTGWREDLGPWTPVLEGDRLYGRGAADDGYAVFAAVTAIQALQHAGRPHARCLVLIEGSEESGSIHLPAYVDHLADRIGEPALVVCLDSGGRTWDRLWVTTSLRGFALFTVKVQVLLEGAHSGVAGGGVPSSFRILRSLLARIEDDRTGDMLLPELQAEIPDLHRRGLDEAAAALGDAVYDEWAMVPGLRLEGATPREVLERTTWHAALAMVGMDGIPSVRQGGNVLRPFTTAKFAVRVPPTVDAGKAFVAMRDVLAADPPHGAHVTVELEAAENGWALPPVEPWLSTALAEASTAAFGQPVRYIGDGGSIPFMGMLGARFPEAQFVVTGVLGPGVNAHGPNEFLHVPTAKRLTEVVADVLAAHAGRPR